MTLTAHPTLPPEIATDLRMALSQCRAASGLPEIVRETIRLACSTAKENLWTPEQLVVAVKEVCFSSTELLRLCTSSEREEIVARVVTGCIREFYRGG